MQPARLRYIRRAGPFDPGGVVDRAQCWLPSVFCSHMYLSVRSSPVGPLGVLRPPRLAGEKLPHGWQEQSTPIAVVLYISTAHSSITSVNSDNCNHSCSPSSCSRVLYLFCPANTRLSVPIAITILVVVMLVLGITCVCMYVCTSPPVPTMTRPARPGSALPESRPGKKRKEGRKDERKETKTEGR